MGEANFAVLPPSAKVLYVKFHVIGPSPYIPDWQSMKVILRSLIRKSFDVQKVPAIWYIQCTSLLLHFCMFVRL